MGPLFAIAGLVGVLLGLINIVHPMSRLRINSRRQAAILLGASSVAILIGAAVSPSTSGTDIVGQGTTTSTSAAATTSTSLAESTAESTSTTTTLAIATTTSVLSLNEDLALDLLLTIPIKQETPSGYRRDLFPLWSDADGDGCDTRDEVLIRDSDGTAHVGSACAVTSGQWYSSYDGVWLDDASQLQIDHVIALKEAWDSGAKEWDTTRREAFANDLDVPELIAVSSSSNQAKSDSDPSNWLPSNADDQCRFIVAVVVVKDRWSLSMDESEFGRIRNLLTGPCQGALISEATPVRPSPPATTSTSPTTTTFVSGPSDVVIATIVYDGPGNDVVYNDSEYLVLHNGGAGTADVGGWRITDLANHQITLPSGYSISPGGDLRLYTGPGDSTAVRYFAGMGQAIWNNSGGDTATLVNSSGQQVDSYSYSS